MGHGDHESTTQLDSYANMAVVGKEVTLISDSGLYAEVRSFSNYVPTLQNIPIVDAVVSYDDLLDEDVPFACSQCPPSQFDKTELDPAIPFTEG